MDTDKGLVVVSGCGHAGIINTLEYARDQVRDTQVLAAVGGFHLFEADNATLDWTATKLRSFALGNLLGAHCTGIEPVFELRQRLGLTRATSPSPPSARDLRSNPGSIPERSRGERRCRLRNKDLFRTKY